MPPPEIPQESPRFPWLPQVHIKRPGLDVATALVVVIISIHWQVARAGGPDYMPDMFVQLGVTWSGFENGKIWQVISYALLHGNWFHLLMNVFMFWLIGGKVIHILGHRMWLKVVFFGILVGGLLHLGTSAVVIKNGFQEARLVGISGACYALLIALITLSPDSKMWPIPISGKNLGLGLILCELLLWLMMPDLGIPMLSQVGAKVIEYGGGGMFQISHACHFGGAMVGWWIARRMLAPSLSLEQLQEMRAKREGEEE